MSLHLKSSSRENLLSLLKSVAKQSKKGQPTQKLAWHQDKVAKVLGYKNWSTLHKHFLKMPHGQFNGVVKQVLANPLLGSSAIKVKSLAVAIDPEAAAEEMRQWVRGNYTPLIDFAFYDKESENGFSWPDVNLLEELQDEFEDQYPFEWIEGVAVELERDAGPWGVEDYGGDEG